MSFHNNISQLCQQALRAYVLSKNLSFLTTAEKPNNVFTSILDETATTPNVLCKCDKARCTVTTEGSWKAYVEVQLRENKDDTEADDHHDHAGELFAQFATATIADDLSAALSEFTAFLVVRVEQGWRVDGRLWVSYLTMEIDCAGSDIS